MNLFAFPFYPALQQQSRFLGGGQVPNALPTPQSRWLPFVLKLPISGQGLDCIRIYKAIDDTLYQTIPSTAFEYDAYSDGEQDYVYYYGGLVAGLNMACNEYYLEAKGHYSEVFTVVRNTAKYLKVQWSNKGGIYQTGFSNIFYLDSVVAEPTYKTEEDGEEDAEGNFVALRTRVTKTLKLDTLPLPEFLVDAVQGIALHSSKEIGRYDDVNSLKVTPTWNKRGNAATLEITFADGPATTSEGCGTDAAFLQIDLSGFVPAPCDGSGPDWVNQESVRCEQTDNGNTGWLEILQLDTKSGNTRWVRYAKNETACPLPTALLKSKEISDQVYRTNCGPNQIAGFVTFVVPEGKFTGTDQSVIDQQAQQFFEDNKEQFANDNATCSAGRRVWIDRYVQKAKVIEVTIMRSDAKDDCLVTIFTQIQGDNGIDVGVHQGDFTKLIPNGQSSITTTLSQGGYVVLGIEVIEITSVNPSDYSF
jgi:hypothetical protein